MPSILTSRINEFFHFKDEAETLTIHGLNLTFNENDLPPDRDLFIYADVVRLQGAIRLPGKNVTIHARRILGDGVTASIDVSGLDGTNFGPARARDGVSASGEGGHGNPGANGRPLNEIERAQQNGKNAGSVRLIAERIEGRLLVLANGGAGGSGESGGDGSSGNRGRNGADGPGRQHVDAFFPGEPGQSGGNGGAAGQGGQGGRGGDAGEIIVQTVEATPAGAITLTAVGGVGGRAGANGQPGDGGQGGIGGVGYQCRESTGPNLFLDAAEAVPDDVRVLFMANEPADVNLGEAAIEEANEPPAPPSANLRALSRSDLLRIKTDLLQQNSVAAFAMPGSCSRTDIRAPNGRNGNRGPVPAPASDGNAGAGRNPVSSLVDPTLISNAASISQALMLLHRAELDYLNSRFNECLTALHWLELLTRTTPSVTEPPGGFPTGTIVPVAAEWNALRERTLTLLAQLRAGLSFFGLPKDNVPLVTLQTFRFAVESMLSVAASLEAEHERYFGLNALVADKITALNTAIDRARSAIRDLEGEQIRLDGAPGSEPLGGLKNETQNEVARLSNAVAVQERILNEATQAFKDAVAARAGAGCSFGDVIRAVGTLISVGRAVSGDVTAIVGAVTAFGEGGKDLPDIVKLVRSVSGNIDDIRNNFNAVRNLFPGQPDAAKLFVDRERFKETLEQFKDLPEAQRLKQQIEVYVQAVQARNQKVLDYTAYALRSEQVRAELIQRNAELTRIQSTRATLRGRDPDLPEYVVFLGKLLNEAKGMLIRALYQEQRAFDYWALRDSNFQVSDSSVATLSATHNRLTNDVLQQLVLFGRGPQSFDFNEVQVELLPADLPEAFARFRQNGREGGRLDFTFDLNSNALGLGRAAVKVSGVRIVIDGVATPNNRSVVAYLLHSGRALFQDVNRGEHQFSHKPRSVRYEYDINTGLPLSQNDTNNLRGAGNDFADLSPFTLWSLFITDELNPGIDRSNITRVQLAFTGFFMPLNIG
jgi:hypothetical protein